MLCVVCCVLCVACRCWLLVVGCRLSVVGCCLCVVGGVVVGVGFIFISKRITSVRETDLTKKKVRQFSSVKCMCLIHPKNNCPFSSEKR